MSTDLSVFKKNDRKVLKKISGKKGGRPVKNQGEKLNQKVTVNFSVTEKQKLMERSRASGGLPITMLIRNVLFEKGYI